MNLTLQTGYVFTTARDAENRNYVYFDLKLTSKNRSFSLEPVRVFVYAKRSVLDAVLIECRKGNQVLVRGELGSKIVKGFRFAYILTYSRPILIVRKESDITKRRFKNLQLNYFSNDGCKAYKHLITKRNRFNAIRARGENKWPLNNTLRNILKKMV